MAVVGELLVLIGANNAALTAGLAKSEAELKGFSGSSAAAALPVAALAAGATFFGIEAVKAGAKFQAAMELIHTQAGASQIEVHNMTAAILALAPTVGIGPEALATGLYHVESAGFRGAAAIDVLTAAAKGAKVGQADLESVTNAMIASVNSGIGGVQNMSQAMGVLNAIVGSGNMRMGDLTAAFTTGILSSAKSFGVSIQSVGAALATMTNAGVPAEDAATRLRMTLSLIGAPTAKATKELAMIGLTSRTLADEMRGPGGIMAAVSDLSHHLQQSGLDATEQASLISKAFGGGRSSSAIMLLLGSLQQFQTIQQQVNTGTGAFEDAWTKTAATVELRSARIGASIGTVVDSIGLGLLPMVAQMLATINPVLDGMASWASQNQGTAATILLVGGGVTALVAALLLLGPILGAIGTAVGVITSPIVLVGAAVTALAAHFGIFGADAKNAVDSVGARVQAFALSFAPVRTALGFVQTGISTVVGWLTTFVTHLTTGRNAISTTGITLSSIATTITTVSTRVATFVGHIIDAANKMGVFKVAGDVINGTFGVLGDTIRILVATAGSLADRLNTGLTIAFGAFKFVVDAIAASVKVLSDGLQTLIDLAGKAVGAIAAIPGVKLGSDVVGNLASALPAGPSGATQSFRQHFRDVVGRWPTPVEFGQWQAGNLPGFAAGGIVPGGLGQPMLAIVHGGEKVTPPDRQSGPVQLTAHFHVSIGGEQIGEWIERRMFNDASGFTSGFAPGSVGG